ncbi:hypothetical protein H2248_002680 [Termitomyces sp. 'cryptogamus']|nr:hypothetical protein H2248_002680 [Termitomyces sp. 'cryptogamus']
MGKKASKQTKKFAASGQLKKVIQARHKHQQIRKRILGKRGAKDDKVRSEEVDNEDEENEVEVPSNEKAKSKKGMSVDEFLNADFMGESYSDDDNVDDMDESDSDDDNEGEDDFDDTSFASVDDLEEDGKNHLMELSKLAEKDPEFFKYLQENDQELLKFNLDDTGGIQLDDEDNEEAGDDDVDMESEKMPTLTSMHLRRWQKALLEVKLFTASSLVRLLMVNFDQQRSLRALRKLLIAFRAAAHLNEDDQVLAWSIDSSSVYNKLVTTTLRYTPVVLEHHVPYKSLPNGKFKPPTQTHKFKTLQKLILSYFHNVIHVLSQFTDNELVQLAVTESAKLIPYIVSSRKAVKLYLKASQSTTSDRNEGH